MSRWFNLFISLLALILLIVNHGECTCSTTGKVCFYGGVTVYPAYTDYVTNTLGLLVEIISVSDWASMTTAEFATCDAIVFADPDCSYDESLLSTAEYNYQVWSAAVDGNILLMGIDEYAHILWGSGSSAKAAHVLQNGLSYVTDNAPYCTGLYVSFSCYYALQTDVAIPLLTHWGDFKMSDPTGCNDNAHIVEPTHEVVDTMTDASFSNWGCSVHEVFDAFSSYPSDFIALVIAVGEGDNILFPDGSSGAPYIIACDGGCGIVDSDGDGIADINDNCPTVANECQGDIDGDGIGDACDDCNYNNNLMQYPDTDLDGVPDICDKCLGGDDNIDSDNDGVPDACDKCPGFNDHDDDDQDMVPNGCDKCPGSDDGIDSDNDGVPDGCDICPGGDDSVDKDGNGIPDACDTSCCISLSDPKACEGKVNGKYHSCDTCHAYVHCSHGNAYLMPCAPADPPLVFDVNKGACVYQHQTTSHCCGF